MKPLTSKALAMMTRKMGRTAWEFGRLVTGAF